MALEELLSYSAVIDSSHSLHMYYVIYVKTTESSVAKISIILNFLISHNRSSGSAAVV